MTMPEERRTSSKSSRGNAEKTQRELEESGKLTDEDRRLLSEKEGKGTMTVEEAGHLGGEIGGQKVKRLIEEGKEYERGTGQSSESKSQRR
jgi:uncharacterized protein